MEARSYRAAAALMAALLLLAAALPAARAEAAAADPIAAQPQAEDYQPCDYKGASVDAESSGNATAASGSVKIIQDGTDTVLAEESFSGSMAEVKAAVAVATVEATALIAAATAECNNNGAPGSQRWVSGRGRVAAAGCGGRGGAGSRAERARGGLGALRAGGEVVSVTPWAPWLRAGGGGHRALGTAAAALIF